MKITALQDRRALPFAGCSRRLSLRSVEAAPARGWAARAAQRPSRSLTAANGRQRPRAASRHLPSSEPSELEASKTSRDRLCNVVLRPFIVLSCLLQAGRQEGKLAAAPPWMLLGLRDGSCGFWGCLSRCRVLVAACPMGSGVPRLASACPLAGGAVSGLLLRVGYSSCSMGKTTKWQAPGGRGFKCFFSFLGVSVAASEAVGVPHIGAKNTDRGIFERIFRKSNQTELGVRVMASA